ncbi:MAG: hypothetical protein K6F78_07050 [Bacteroidaceae bacterium]|nr:hypothetical protein [Bacteroidaceae bacterium]
MEEKAKRVVQIEIDDQVKKLNRSRGQQGNLGFPWRFGIVINDHDD